MIKSILNHTILPGAIIAAGVIFLSLSTIFSIEAVLGYYSVFMALAIGALEYTTKKIPVRLK